MYVSVSVLIHFYENVGYRIFDISLFMFTAIKIRQHSGFRLS